MSNDNKREVGTATAGESVKNLWRKENYQVAGKKASLKTFARQLVAAGNQSAKDWFDCKKGALNEARSEKNKLRVAAEMAATKASKKAKKKA